MRFRVWKVPDIMYDYFDVGLIFTFHEDSRKNDFCIFISSDLDFWAIDLKITSLL